VFCGDGGWLAAAKAINAIGEFLRQQGVNFGFGGYVNAAFGEWEVPVFLTLSIELEPSSDRCLQRTELRASAWRPQTGPNISQTKSCWLRALGVQH
jgi:sarcosine oxidase/L-pipecolate oxidase